MHKDRCKPSIHLKFFCLETIKFENHALFRRSALKADVGECNSMLAASHGPKISSHLHPLSLDSWAADEKDLLPS